MNELRMYVERLFEGKVLTAENIELKEEIYGNLVARYEDYVAGGMTEPEALEKTKASITSIEDVLEGEDGAGAESAAHVVADAQDSAAADADATRMMGAQPERPVDPAATGMGAAAGSSAAVAAGAAAATMEMPRPQGAPVPPVGTNAQQTPKAPRKKWPFIVGGIAAAIVVLAIVGAILFNILDEADLDDRPYSSSQVTAADNTPATDAGTATGQGNGNGGGNGAANGNGAGDGTGPYADVPRDRQGYEIWCDDSGRLRHDDDLADELLESVVASGYGDVSPYVGTSLSDAAAVKAFLSALPMGSYASSVDVSQGNGTLSFRFDAVPDHYDGDSIDAALVYDATAIMCAMPDVSSVAIQVNESDDHHSDYDYYVFDRSMLENRYGVALTGDLVNEAGWTQLKRDNLYCHDFIDRTCEQAERS